MPCGADPSWTPYITGIGGVIAGAITSYLVGVKLSGRNHANALALMKRQEANKAFLALEATFLPALRILRKDHLSGEDFDRFPTLFENQDIAMLSFVGHLSSDNRRVFGEKWSKYQEWQKEYEELVSRAGNGILLIGTQRNEKINIIEDILDAAKKY